MADEHLVWLPYSQMQTVPAPLPVASTNGTRITLADGRELIDGIASWWTACHGYNHPHIVAAIEQQVRVMPHVMLGGLTHQPAQTLARRLVDMLPGDLGHVFYTDSGSVAVEVALKMAIQFWLNQGVSGRTKFVCFNGSYHGDTLGAMSLCDPAEGMHKLFAGYMPQQITVDLPRDAASMEQFDKILTDRRAEIAAVVVEPLVQGAGGMKFHDGDVLASIRRLCDAHDILLIADEIFTGFGRTGTMFACEAAAITPDIICLGKALTGGALTLAATVATDRIYEAFLSEEEGTALMHGPTFMGNPLACAAANASLDLFESEPRLAQVAAIEEHLQVALAPMQNYKGVVDVRVKGAIGVVQVAELRDLNGLKKGFVDAGLWVRPFGDIIYITPSFSMTDADIETLTSRMADVIGGWSQANF